MKFITVLVAALLPLAALAAPVADAEPVAEPMPEPVEVAEPDVPGTSAVDSRDVLKRATEYCYIIGNDGNVACRSGPGTGYPVVVRMVPGNGYYFTCYKTGTVVGGNKYVHLNSVPGQLRE